MKLVQFKSGSHDHANVPLRDNFFHWLFAKLHNFEMTSLKYVHRTTLAERRRTNGRNHRTKRVVSKNGIPAAVVTGAGNQLFCNNETNGTYM